MIRGLSVAVLLGSATVRAAGPIPANECPDLRVFRAVELAVQESGGTLDHLKGQPYRSGSRQPMGAYGELAAEPFVEAARGLTPAEKFDLFLRASEANGLLFQVADLRLVVDGGQLRIEGKAYTAEQVMQEASRDFRSVLAGGGWFDSVPPALASQEFLDIPAMVRAGIRADNFAQKVTTSQQLHALWFTEYRRELARNPTLAAGEIENELQQAWPLVEANWRLRRAAQFIVQFGNALSADVYRVQSERVAYVPCPWTAAPMPQPAPPPPPPPAPALTGTVFTLIAVKPDAAYPTWTVQLQRIEQKLPASYGRFEWTAPPQQVGSGGASMQLSLHAQANQGQRLKAGVTASGGFTFVPAPAHAEALADSDAKDASIVVQLIPPATATPGSTIQLRVGADYGPGVTYWYEAK